MKTAIYIEDGTVQLVLTPENDFEKNALASFESEQVATQIYHGTFYDCRGGWIRQSVTYGNPSERSLILRTVPVTLHEIDIPDLSLPQSKPEGEKHG